MHMYYFREDLYVKFLLKLIVPKDIILVQTGKRLPMRRIYLPLSLLPLAGVLVKNGYNPMIFDTRIDRLNELKSRLNDAICLGISCWTGPQILDGIKVATYARDINPNMPIVWGGVHPSSLPLQTIKNRFVDIVVKGEGEETLLELTQKIESGKGIDDVKGIVYKKNGKIKVNPDRKFIDLDMQELPPFHLLRLEKYTRLDKFFSYQSSRGCPHNCTFCYNHSFNKSIWRAKSPEKVLYDIQCIVEQFDPEIISFVEDNFFVGEKRVKEICTGIIKEGFDFKWSSTCRVDYFSRYPTSFIKLLRKSGCYQLAFGAESGSQRVLDWIKKDIRVSQTLEMVNRCKKFGITPIIAFMCGIPNEEREDLSQTIELVDRIRRISRNARVSGIFIYTPFPGSPLFDDVKRKVKLPNSLEEWGHFYLSQSCGGLFDKDYESLIEAVSRILRFKSFANKHQVLKLLFLLYFSANLRWKYKTFTCPIEWKLWSYLSLGFLEFF